MKKKETLTDYAGVMGKPEGVSIDFTNFKNGIVKVKYYAWNNRSGSTDGYGTKYVDINLMVIKII